MEPNKITIDLTHFEWLNHEVLRLSDLARSYWDRGERLQRENKELKSRIAELEASIISGGAITPDAAPVE
jgi:hypothetical protein